MNITRRSFLTQLTLSATLLAALLVVLAPLPANAKKKKKADPGFYKGTVIKLVNPSTQTIEIETMKGHTTHTYKIDALTVITVAGSPGRFANLKFGQQVQNLVERDNDTLDAITVDAADKYVPVK
jgi:hypothetical protein